MARNTDYDLILSHLIQSLDPNPSYLPLARKVEPTYSLTEPSVKFSTTEFPLIMYDIVTNPEITVDIVQKWKSLCERSSFLYVLVHDSLKEKSKAMCAKENLINCLILTYRFKVKNTNRNVQIDF
ncbi:hypothetical protein [Aurantibacillus circumpalustris]|uniref:hypothetical protein n=1 Tax=Aurantibacillus circumpalustris TaxID=3036359 RepID=UPI00295AF1FF|nr:hypothetical protein [Aurantibacillus circumpalustris]